MMQHCSNVSGIPIVMIVVSQAHSPLITHSRLLQSCDIVTFETTTNGHTDTPKDLD